MAITFLYIFTAFYLFSSFRVWLAIVFPVIGGMLSVYGASFIYMAFTEGTERLKTKRMFSQYLSPSVLSEVMESKALTAEIGATKELTVLFSDIRGFTSISESLESRKVVEMLNYYLHEMVELVFKYNGTLDKFIGDAVMAFWGAPIEVKNHARQAISCALEMIKKLDEVNSHFRLNNFPDINIGIGLNTGPVIVGNIGSTKRLDYTVIGDNVNLASRIEGLTKKYGCPILISESAHNMLDDQFICRTIDRVQVKGKTEPATLYEPLTNPETHLEKRRLAERVAQLTDTGFHAYLKKDWEAAENAYQQVLLIDNSDSIADIFIKRVQEFKSQAPPEAWDGCYIYTTK
jgi:adenylate cyclase